MKIALISCSARKQKVPCIASEMYAPSQIFSLSYEYAKQIADRVYILSAKHELLDENTYIETYNLSLTKMKVKERRNWAQNVISQLQEKCDIRNDEFIILAGRIYYVDLLPALTNFTIPLKHESLFDRPAALKQLLQQIKTEGSEH